MEESKLVWFPKNILYCMEQFKKCLKQGMDVLYDKDGYAMFYFLNSYCGWMQLEPIVTEAVIFLLKKDDESNKQDKWRKHTMNFPIMRIKIVPTAFASCSVGPGMASFDNIQIKYYKGVDLSGYDDAVKKWQEKVFDQEGKVRTDCRNHYIDAPITFGKELCSFKYRADDVYEKEKQLYDGICDGTAFKKLIELNECKLNNILEESPL